ncbi:hypothetical protein [Saccharopolyspora pogona]|uniref:hypothetical protein n=1 Tax=Saccharopolyspora pogona TaxID=333966 RepID=UPI0016865D87|nr:hypothetical protein [Saccharopolyspora pogona]
MGNEDYGISSLAADAIAIHDIYKSFVIAGFNEDQAFKMVQTIVSSQIMGGSAQ